MKWNNLFIFPLPCLHPKLNSLLCPIIYVSINLSSPLVASFDQENLKRQECLILLRMSIPMKNIYNSKKLDFFCLFLFKTTQIKVLNYGRTIYKCMFFFPIFLFIQNITHSHKQNFEVPTFSSLPFLFFFNFNLSLVAMKKPHALLHASKPPLLVSKNVPSPSLLPFFVSNHFAKKL